MVLQAHVERDAGLEEVPGPVPLGHLPRRVDQLVQGLRRLRRIEPGLLHELPVPEEREGADRGRHGIVPPVHLHLPDERVEVALDLRGVEQLGGQGLQQLGLQVILEPPVEELHHVGPLSGGNRGRDLQPEVVVRDVGVLHPDAGVRRLEALDELVDGLDALREGVLPVLDLDRLRARRPRERHHHAQRRHPQLARAHAPPCPPARRARGWSRSLRVYQAGG